MHPQGKFHFRVEILTEHNIMQGLPHLQSPQTIGIMLPLFDKAM